MLNRTATLTAAVAIALLALPAAAGSWPNIAPRKAQQASAPLVRAPAQSIDGFVAEPGENVASLEPVRYFTKETSATASAARAATNTPVADAAATYVSGFEFVGGETGWQPAVHKFVWSAGRFAHSDECDHAIRVVSGPTPAEIDAAKTRSPGA